MKKSLRILLSVLLILSILLITMSFIVENTVIKTFSQEILSKKVSSYFLDKLVYDLDVNDLGKIENNIRKSKYTEKITSKFIQTITKNVAYNQNIKFDISNEIDSLILENMPENFYTEKVDTTKAYLIDKLSNTEKGLEENFIYSFGKDYLIILKSYNILTTTYCRIIMVAISIIAIIGLVIIDKIKVIKLFKINSIIVTTFTAITFILIKAFANFIDQRLTGGWLSSINLNLMIIFIILELLISLVLFIIQKKMKLDNITK